MGQRAVFGYTDEQGISRVTTVQWSTVIDQTMNAVMKNMVNDERDFRSIASEIFGLITQHEHISALEIQDDEYREKYGEYLKKEITVDTWVEEGKNQYLTVSGAYASDYDNTVTGNIAEEIKSHDHAQDGISMWYDAKHDPDTIHFWIADGYEYIHEGRELNNLTAQEFMTTV